MGLNSCGYPLIEERKTVNDQRLGFVLNESVAPQRKSNIRFVTMLRIKEMTLMVSKLFK